MKWIIRLLIAAVLIYISLVALLYVTQRKLLYFPPSLYHAPPDWMKEVRSKDGSLSWWAAPERDTAPVVMVFHGNASSIDSLSYIFRELKAEGYGILSLGYPGYPGNEDGTATQETLTQAAIAQYDHIISRGIAPERIVFYGTSLGSGVASQLASQRQPRLLILDAPFQSTEAIAQSNMPIIPISLLMKDTYRSDLALQRLDMPLIWMHGQLDRVIPLSSGQALYDEYSGPKSMHIFEGAAHHNTWFHGGQAVVMEALADLEAEM